MKKKSIRNLISIFLGVTFFYLASFNNFFFQDDFFNIKLSQSQTIIDAFNIFKKPILGFDFYRPFSTQLFWKAGWGWFGLNPFGYHVIAFAFFLLSIYLAYKLAKEIFSDERVALFTSFFYAFAASHFYRLFFLSQFQEISLAVFTFATLYLFYKKSNWAPILFIGSLTNKETAVMIVPFMLLVILLDRKDRQKYLRLFYYCLGILALYLFARFFYFGFAGGSSYTYDFGIHSTLNNIFWYVLWSIGMPEAFVNVKFFHFPTILNPKLFTSFNVFGNLVLASFGLFMLTLILPVVKYLKKIEKKILIPIALFLLFILPVAFYPFHKFPYSLAVPVFGISIFLGYISSKLNKKALLLVFASYLLLSINAYQFNLSNHWAVRKAYSAEKVFLFFRENYPKKIVHSNIYFRNTILPMCPDLKDYPRFSLEVSYGIGDKDGLRLLYKDDKLPVYFEDTDNYRHLNKNSLVIDSRSFVR